MRKFLLAISNNFLLLLFLSILITSCKKNQEPRSSKARISFTYNGKKYTLPGGDNNGYWAVYNYGLEINRPDIFNGSIFFPKNRCAYFQPSGMDVLRDDNCQLSSQGLPVDSTAVYFFESGNITISYNDCYTKSGTDFFTGLPFTQEYCYASGSFNLTLKNKNGNTIVITEGRVDDLLLAH